MNTFKNYTFTILAALAALGFGQSIKGAQSQFARSIILGATSHLFMKKQDPERELGRFLVGLSNAGESRRLPDDIASIIGGYAENNPVYDFSFLDLGFERKLNGYLLAFSANGQYIAAAQREHGYSVAERHIIELRPIAQSYWKWTKTFSLRGHTDKIISLSFSKDGKSILSASHDGTIKLWNRSQTDPIKTIRDPDGVTAVAFNSDETRIISISSRHTAHKLKLWDRKTGACIKTSKTHDNYIDVVRFSPNGKRVAFMEFDNTFINGRFCTNNYLSIWDASTATQIQRLELGAEWSGGMAWNADGSKIVTLSTGDNPINVWDVATGARLQTFRDQDNYDISSVAFSADGQYIISISEKIRVWDALSGDIVQTLNGGFRSVIFGPDADYIALISGDETIQLWHNKNSVRATIKAARKKADEDGYRAPTSTTWYQKWLSFALQRPMSIRSISSPFNTRVGYHEQM